MDIQAILDETDSSSSSEGSDTVGLNGLSKSPYNSQTNHSATAGLDTFQYSNALEAAMKRTTTNATSRNSATANARSPAASSSPLTKPPAAAKSYGRQISALTVDTMGYSCGVVDLEQILQDDGDDEDDDEDWKKSATPTSSFRPSASQSPAYSQTTAVTQARHNPDDWDVLQAILGEDEDGTADEDDDDDVSDDANNHGVKNASANRYNTCYGMDDEDDDDDPVQVYSLSEWKNNVNLSTGPGTPNYSSHILDAILNSDDEDDDDFMKSNLNTDLDWNKQNHVHGMPSTTGLTRNISNHSFTTDMDNSTLATTEHHGLLPLDHPSHHHTYTDMDVSGLSVASSGVFGLNSTANRFLQQHLAQSSNGAVSSSQFNSTPLGMMPQRDKQDTLVSNADMSERDLRKASKRSIEFAKEYERKLLKSGHRDIVSPLMVKRRLKPRIELPTKQRLQQRRKDNPSTTSNDREASRLMSVSTTTTGSAGKTTTTTTTSVNMPKFRFSGVLEEKTMAGINRALVMNQASHDGQSTSSDLPTALAVNSRFIAVGTQGCTILVFDLFEVLRHTLGGKTSGTAQAESANAFSSRKAGSVTAIDLSCSTADVLVAGYTSGWIVLWDTIKGTVIRACTDIHPTPITSVRFSSVDYKVVTVDAAGLVNKVTFSKNMLWNSYSYDTECLLDGTAGQILALDVLTPLKALLQSHSSSKTLQDLSKTRSFEQLKRIGLIALSSERSSFAVAVEPSVHVLHRWPRPAQERIDPLGDEATSAGSQIYLPCLTWGWALVQGGGNVLTPILARAWGCCVQFLRASYPMLEEDGMDHNGGGGGAAEMDQWPAFGIQDEFEVPAPVVAMEWLNDRSLIFLTVNNEFTVIDTVMMTLLERLDFSGLQLIYAEFKLSQAASKAKGGRMQQNRSFCTTFQNSIQSWDGRLLVLCQSDIKAVSIVGAKRRISSLEQDGEWLEALALALNHYENTIKSQENRRRKLIGSQDLSQHPEFANGAVKSEDEEWIAKLLIRYLNIAVENAPDSQPIAELSHLDLATSHFQMLAGVCVEFCVVTRRLDLLFGPIFRRFHLVGYLSVFLDVLEPYILNDKLDYIAPEAMAHFIEHCRSTNGISTVERCLLHMNVTIMDFDSILGLLKANEMYSALFYVFNRGLDDFTTPLEILLEKIFDAADTGALHGMSRRLDGVPSNDLELYGYKAITYLQSCFQGRMFPQDNAVISEERLHSLRPQLLRFLLKETFAPSRSVKSHDAVIGARALHYPYAQILIMVDPIAMFETMAMALDAPDSEFKSESNFESIGGWEVEVSGSADSGSSVHGSSKHVPDRQQVISMFLSIIIPEDEDKDENQDQPGKEPTSGRSANASIFRAPSTVNAFLDFLAEYLMKGIVRANKTVTFMILERLAQQFEACQDPSSRQEAQGRIISLLTALPRNSYETEQVLTLVEKSDIHRAALLLHQEGASNWHDGANQERRTRHFRAAIDCYLDDEDETFQLEVFAYAKKECSGSTTHDSQFASSEEPTTLRDALASKLGDMVRLSPLMAAELVSELFVEDLDKVITSLATADGGKEAQFMFLKAIISGDLNQKDPVAGSVLSAQLTMEHHHKYLELMASLHPDSVYEYLSTHNNYRPEQCLELCQRHGIADASAYLLERMGNVSSALQLVLQTLESRMMNLKRTIRGLGTDFFRQHSATVAALRWRKTKVSSVELYGKQEQDVEAVKRILVVALDLCERNSQQGSQFWFNVLDRLINAKSFLRLSKEQPGHAKLMGGVLGELLRLTMQRMVSSVPLPDLVRKVTSDHSGSDVGELRQMIDSLLSTYGLELNVFDGAVAVFKHDLFKMERHHQSLKVSGSGVRSILSVELEKENAAQNKALLESTASRGDILQLTDGGKASLSTAGKNVGLESYSHSGLGSALSRLRSRRSTNTFNPQNPTDRSQVTSLNFMSVMEQDDMRGERPPDSAYFEERLSGVMGEAQHRGRLMSFIY